MSVLESEIKKQQELISSEIVEEKQKKDLKDLENKNFLGDEHSAQVSEKSSQFEEIYEHKLGAFQTVSPLEIMDAPKPPSKHARDKTKRKYQADVAKRKRQEQRAAYFNASHDAIKTGMEAEAQKQDEIPEIDLSKEDENLSWVKTKFVDWGNKDNNAAQLEAAKGLTEARDLLALERARETKDEYKVTVLTTILNKMAVCTDSYAKNEREIRDLAKLNIEDFKTEALSIFDVQEEEAARKAAFAFEKLSREKTRQILMLEIQKLRGFVICAKDGVNVEADKDVTYLGKLGVDVDKFNKFAPSDNSVKTIKEEKTEAEQAKSKEEQYKRLVPYRDAVKFTANVDRITGETLTKIKASIDGDDKLEANDKEILLRELDTVSKLSMPLLEGELAKVSIDFTKERAIAAVIMEAKECELALRSINEKERIHRMNIKNIGGDFSSLIKRAEQSLIGAEYTAFMEKIKKAMEKELPYLRKQIKEDLKEDLDESLNGFLVQSELHPGVAKALAKLSGEEQRAFATKVSGEPASAIAAIEDLLKDKPELDDICLTLKQKAISGEFARDKALAGDAKTQEALKFQTEKMHDAVRNVRLFRNILNDRVDKLKKQAMGLKDEVDLIMIAVAQKRLTEYLVLPDKALLQNILSGQFKKEAGDDLYLFINAYAQMRSSELGHDITADELKKEPCCVGLDKTDIAKALSGGFDSRENRKTAENTLEFQKKLYDPQRLGNRFMNFLGDLLAKDLSDEHMAFRALQVNAEREGVFEARQLEVYTVRDLLDIKTGNSLVATEENLSKALEKTDTHLWEWNRKVPIAEQIHRAGAAAAFEKEKKERKEAEKSAKSLAQNQVSAARAAIGLDDNAKGATLALTILALDKVLTTTEKTQASMKPAEFKLLLEQAKTIKSSLPLFEGHYNLLAMASFARGVKNDKEGTIIQEDFTKKLKLLLDSKDKDAFIKNARSLKAIIDMKDLTSRAKAALEVKEANEESFDEKIKKVIGDGKEMSEIQDYLKTITKDAEQIKKESDQKKAEKLKALSPREKIGMARTAAGMSGKVHGATLAFSILALDKVLTTAKEANDSMDEKDFNQLLKQTQAIESKLPTDNILTTHYNLLAMASSKTGIERDKEEKKIHEAFKKALDLLIQSKDKDAFLKHARSLKAIMDENDLADRAKAALEVKGAEESFDEKIKNAIGDGQNMSGLRDHLKTFTEDMGSEMRMADGADDKMTGSLLLRLSWTTEVLALQYFQQNNSIKGGYAGFHEKLKSQDNDEYKDMKKSLMKILSSIEDKEGGPSKLTQEQSAALAEWTIEQFVNKVGVDPNKWLSDKAGKYQTLHADALAKLKMRDMEAAADALDVAIKQITIEDAVTRLKSSESISIGNYTKGGVKAEAMVVPTVTASVALEAAVNNDLTIERDAYGVLSVTIGNALMAKVKGEGKFDIAENLGISDVASLSATAAATLQGGMARGVKLDFDDNTKCQTFLKYLFSAIDTPEDVKEKQRRKIDTPEIPEDPFSLANRTSVIHEYSGGLILEAGVSAGINLSGVVDKVLEIDELKSAKDAVGTVSDHVIGKAQKLTDKAVNWTKGWTTGVVTSILDGVSTNTDAVIDKMLQQTDSDLVFNLASKAVDTSKIRELIPGVADTLKTSFTEAVSGLDLQIKDLVESLQGTATEKIGEKIGEKITALTQAVIDKIKSKDKEPKTAFDADQELKEKIKDAVQELVASQVKGAIEGKIGELLSGAEKESKSKEEEKTEEEKKAEEDSEDGFKLVDAALSASLEMSASRKSENKGNGKKTISTTAGVKAEATLSASVLGAKAIDAKKQGNFEAVLARDYTGEVLTGATMSRKFHVNGGIQGAVNAREIIKGFGAYNDSIVNDLASELKSAKDVTMTVEAQLTQMGLEKYQKAVEENKSIAAAYILADRSNYRLTAINLEVQKSSSSVGYGFELNPTAAILGDKGKVQISYGAGANSARTETRSYVPHS
ncbi:hypothetical protein FACS1894111_06620 [Clostridia bacterium]|nr:hypothetical protein FACS1894111_06620 [Clostridia bacterium]